MKKEEALLTTKITTGHATPTRDTANAATAGYFELELDSRQTLYMNKVGQLVRSHGSTH